jgi:NAD(P)-dependent dehydrogenase (short-subunit alcohol dehydrogenase family)
VTRDAAQRASVAAVIVGLVLGATSAAGIVLLLYTGQGFLRAAGLLVSSTIMAVAAGVWAAAPQPRMSRARWVALALALLVAGIVTALWGTREDVRGMASAGAFTVLLVLALPAYTAGLVLAGLQASSRNNAVASGAAAGAATGILLATTVLIQMMQPYGIFYGGGLLVSLTSLLTRATRADGDTDMHAHVALITGVGSAGQLGYAIAQRFVSAGARVIITSRGDTVQQLATQLAGNEEVLGVQADLLDDADVERLLQTIAKRYGRLDALINAAGGLTHIASIADTTPEQWRQEIERNADTALRMCRAALPLLRTSHGAIVNFTSPAGERASAQLGAYSAGKAAVIALTRALALEEKGHGVRVNAIAPGMMDTEQNRAGAAPEAVFVPRTDVAAAAFFLASPEGRGISGDVLHVMGPALE